MQVIGLHIEPYFAEVCVRKAGALQESRALFYLPRQKLTPSLTKFLSELEVNEAVVAVSFRYLERLAGFRLGGSTAQVVTSGLEQWSFFNPGLQNADGHVPRPRPALCSPDLSFGVSERLSVSGDVLTPLQETELEAIADKLTLQKAKRVCLHFMHAPKNTSHQEKAAEFFRQRGFEVHAPVQSDDADEVPRWRLNTLQASLSGTFEDLKQEVAAALPENLRGSKIHFLGENGWSEDRPTHLALCGTMADRLWSEHLKKPFVSLGLERWTVVDPSRTQKTWFSPWGPIPCEQPMREDLLIQPGQVLESVADFSEDPADGGFEPGPVCFGRGQKLLVFDLFGENAAAEPSMKAWIAESGVQRRDDLLRALERSRPGFRANRTHLMGQIRDRLRRHVSWFAGDTDIPWVGPMASWLDERSKEKASTASLLAAKAAKDLLS